LSSVRPHRQPEQEEAELITTGRGDLILPTIRIELKKERLRVREGGAVECQ
jgi:hypothetical protein